MIRICRRVFILLSFTPLMAELARLDGFSPPPAALVFFFGLGFKNSFFYLLEPSRHFSQLRIRPAHCFAV